MKNKRSSAAFLLALCLLAGSIAWHEDMFAGAAPKEPGEVLELRESNSKTYLLDDGTYEAHIFAEDIHYTEGDGKEYKDIVNTLVDEKKTIDETEYIYRNEANKITARLAADASGDSVARIELGEYSVSSGLVNKSSAEAQRMDKLDIPALEGAVDPAASVIYKNISPDTDLIYEVKNHGIKEYLIIRKATEQTEFAFTVKAEGLTAKQGIGGVYFTNSKGESVFDMGNLFIMDSEHATPKDEEQSFSISGENGSLYGKAKRIGGMA